jgi:hypothetical protein
MQVPIPKTKVDEYSAYATTLEKFASEVEVNDQDSYERAADILGKATRGIKNITVFQDSILQPFKDGLKDAKATFTKMKTPYEKAETQLRAKVNAYARKMQAIADKEAAEERARVAAERKKAEAEAAARKAENERKAAEAAAAGKEVEPEPEPEPIEEVVPVPVQAPDLKVNTSVGSTHTVKRWKYRITDFKIVPDEFKQENTKLLNAQAKTRAREIPGVEFYQEVSVAVRS